MPPGDCAQAGTGVFGPGWATGVAFGEGQPPVERVAASDFHEAIAYMLKWHSDLDIQRVELVAVIEIVSGSPLN